MKLKRNESKEIEKAFFDIDEEKSLAKVILHYERLEDIVDTGFISALPVLNEDFTTHIKNAFDLVSSRYKIDLTIRFDDMGGYTKEQICDFMWKNLLLEIQRDKSENKRRKRIGYMLIVIGALCLMAMLMIEHLWIGESVIQDVFFYIADIATMVSFWEALVILLVEQTENEVIKKYLEKRLAGIHFEQNHL